MTCGTPKTVQDEEGGSCKDLPCAEGMTCDQTNSATPFCKKVITCGERNRKCNADSDCCSADGLICVEFLGEKTCTPGTRKTNGVAVVATGQKCNNEVGPLCDEAGGDICANKGATGHRCVKKVISP